MSAMGTPQRPNVPATKPRRLAWTDSMERTEADTSETEHDTTLDVRQ